MTLKEAMHLALNWRERYFNDEATTDALELLAAEVQRLEAELAARESKQ